MKLQRSESTGITAEKVLKRIDRIAAMSEETGDMQAALRANELLGKHLKLFTDKIEQSGSMSFTVVTNVPNEDS